ncbi:MULTISPECIES: MFS transporter [unclassified Sphingomonas]|uniref:MFS transporter n=1 Tax=Novosphingobium rhizosphaerae TaxID=1551649 RepID=UPI0015CEB503
MNLEAGQQGEKALVASPAEARPVALGLLQRPFLSIWALRGLSVLGNQLIAFALSLELYQTTGSVLYLGLLGLIQFVPGICFALPAGHLIDRFPPGRVAAIAQVVNALAGLILLVPTVMGLPVTAAALFAAALITGFTRAFEHPVNTALIPQVVAPEHVGAAVAWTMSVAKVAGLGGPLLAGVLYAINPQLSFGVAVVLWLAAAVAALSLPAPSRRPAHQPLGLKSAFAGFAVIWRDRVLGGAMVLDLVAVLFGGATALLPAVALDLLHVDAVGLGILRAAPGLGAVALGIWLARHPVSRNSGSVLIGATLVFGLLTCAFGLSRSFVLSSLLLAGIGAADMVSIHIRSALVQLRTPPELRGRVGAVNGIFISSSNQIGAFESGVTADLLGLVPAIVLGGAVTTAAVLVIAARFASLRQLRSY